MSTEEEERDGGRLSVEISASIVAHACFQEEQETQFSTFSSSASSAAASAAHTDEEECHFNKQKDILLLDLRREIYDQYICSTTEPQEATSAGSSNAERQHCKPSTDRLDRISPFEELISQQPYGLGCGLTLLIYFVVCVLYHSLNRRLEEQTATHFRFTALELRGGQVPSEPSIAEFGLLQDGCKVHLSNATISAASLTMSAAEPISHDGWWWRMATDSDTASAPVRFQLEGSDDGIHWQVQGGSTWKLSGWDGLRFGTGRMLTSESAGEIVRLSHKEHWPWLLYDVTPTGISAGLVVAVLLARSSCRCRRPATEIARFTMCAAFAAYTAAALGFVVMEHPLAMKLIPRTLIHAFASLWLPFSVDMMLLPTSGCIFVTGFLVLLGRVVEAEQLGMMHTLREDPSLSSLLLMAAGLACMLHVYLRARRGRIMVLDDHRVYDARWGLIEGQQQRHLEVLRRRTDALQARITQRGEARQQLNPQMDSQSAAALGLQPMRATLQAVADRQLLTTVLDSNAPVVSLDQLLMQGRTMMPILRWKVLKWARGSQGFLTLAVDGKLVEVPWVDAMTDERFKNGAAGMQIKSRERALEKAIQRYQSDVSRLLDISRQRIVFNRAADLLECLNCITRDPEIRLVCVRNSMVGRQDASDTVGYRDVKVNLRIESKLTRALGVDGHVCEILLALKDMALLQTEASHRRYQQFRDIRERHLTPWESLRRRSRWLRGRLRCSCVDEDDAPPSPTSKRHELMDEDVWIRAIMPTASGGVPESHMALSSPSNIVRFRSWFSAGARLLSAPELPPPDPELQAVSEPVKAEIKAQFRQLTCLPANFLQQQVSEITSALRSANADSLLFTSRPIPALVSRLRWQLVLLLLAMSFAFQGVVWYLTIEDTLKGVAFRHYRFTPLELRDGTVNSTATPILSPHVSRFHLLRDNCPIPTAEYTLKTVGAQMILTVQNSEPLWINGWALETDSAQPDKDPVRFCFEGAEDAEEPGGELEWEDATSVSSLHSTRGSVISHQVLRFPTPLERGVNATLDLRVRTAKYLTNVALGWVSAVFACLMFLFGRFKMVERALASWYLLLTSSWAIQTVAAVLYFRESRENGVYWLVYALPFLMLCIVTATREAYLVNAVLFAGLFLLVWDTSAAVLLFKEPISIIWTDPSMMGCTLLSFAGIAHLYRLRVSARCHYLIARDKAKYDELWEKLRAERDGESKLALVAEHVGALVTASTAQDRQLNLRSLRPLDGDSDRTSQDTRLPCSSDRLHSFPSHSDPVPEEPEALPAPAALLSGVDAAPHPPVSDATPLSVPERLPAVITPQSTSEVLVEVGWSAESPCRGADGGESALWHQIAKEGSNFRLLHTVASAESTASAALRGTLGRRIHDLWSRTVSRLKTVHRQGSVLDLASPVVSLDQLYAQARGLDPILRRKVCEWAMSSRGLFPMTKGRIDGEDATQTFMLWEEAQGVCEEDVKWGQLKSPDRAVEKLLRSYGQDVSRLLDICRQHIVFETLEDMADCLRFVRQDPEVVVVRAKNRMAPDFNSACSAGYRDVSLNLRVETEETRVLGLAGHVCELQLQLQEFAALRNHDGHARYVQYRNFKAQ